MRLEEGPKAGCRDPQSYILPCLDFDVAREGQANLDSITVASNVRTAQAYAHGLVPVDSVS
jgi:hypothetical protein